MESKVSTLLTKNPQHWTQALQLQQTEMRLISQTDFLLNTDKCNSMELQNANLTPYCIPFCGVETKSFIPVASEAVYVHFPS